MRKGVIVRDTPAHVMPELWRAQDFAIAEVDAWERCMQLADGRPDVFPMVSAFLGAKTWEVKKLEMRRARLRGAQRVLLFPDFRNIAYGNFHAFRSEIEAMYRETVEMEPVLCLELDWLPPGSLETVLGVVAPSRFDVMLGFDAGNAEDRRSIGDLMRPVLERVRVERIWCAFWNPARLDEARAELVSHGIQWAAAIL